MNDYRIRIIVDGQDNASGPLGKVGSALGKMGTIAGGILTADVLKQVAGGVVSLANAAKDSYASYERLGMSLQSLVAKEIANASGGTRTLAGSMDEAKGKAQDLQGWIQKLAIESPFTQQGVAEAFRMAMAYGFTTDQAKRLTTAMIDFSSATGQDESSMARIALALGQVRAKGKLAGQEVLQLTEAGLSVDAILAKAFNKSTAEIVQMREKGLIPADKAIEAITQSLEQDFGGAAKRQANTFSGLLSSLQDIKEVGLREFFSGTFQAIQPYLVNFVNWITKPEIMGSIREWGDRLGKFVAKFALMGQQIVMMLQRGNLKGAINVLLVNLFGPEAINNAQGTILEFLSNLIGKMITGLVTNQAKIMTFALTLINGISGAIVAALPMLLPLVTQLISVLTIFITQTLPMLIPAGLQILIGLINAVVAALPTLLPVAIQMLATLAIGIAQAIPQLLPAVIQIIPTVIQILLNNLPLLINAAIQVIMALANGLIQNLPLLIAAIPQIVTTLVQTIITLAPQLLESAVTLIVTLVSGLVQNLPKIGEAAGQIIQTVVSGIVSLAGKLLEAGRQIVEGVWQGISNSWDYFWGQVSGFFSGIVNGVKKLLGIASPSKVFSGVGLNMMKGLAQGINKGSVLPDIALQGVTANLTGSMAGASSGGNTDARSWNLYLTTSQSPNVVQSSFEILRVLEYGA